MKCHEAQEILYDALYDLVDAGARGLLKVHLAECIACRQEYETLERLDRGLDAWQVQYRPIRTGKVLPAAGRIRRRVAGTAAAAVFLIVLGYLIRGALQDSRTPADVHSQLNRSLHAFLKGGKPDRSDPVLIETLQKDPSRMRAAATLADAHPDPMARKWFEHLVRRTDFSDPVKSQAIPVFYELIVRYAFEESEPEMASICMDKLCRLKGVDAADRERMVLTVHGLAGLRAQANHVRDVFEEAVSNVRGWTLESIGKSY